MTMRKWRTRRVLNLGGRWGLSNASLVFETVNSSLNKNSWSLEISGDLQGNRRGAQGKKYDGTDQGRGTYGASGRMGPKL